MKRKFKGKKSYAVFGMGEFGKSVAISLAQSGADVMAIDTKEEELSEVAGCVTDTRVMDATDIRAYAKLGLSNMDAVVIGITGNMDATLMAILQAVEANVEIIVAKANNDTQAKIFSKIGATQIITPGKSEGRRLARLLRNRDIFEFVELKEDVCMLEILVNKEWVGKNLIELNLRHKHKINVIALIRDGKTNMAVDPRVKLKEGDHMLIVTDKKSAEAIAEED